MTAPDASRSFFKNVKAYKSKEKPNEFDVRELYEGKNDTEVAEALDEHFGSISQEFNGLDQDINLDAGNYALPVLQVLEVASRLRKFKKPKSMVKGDIFPT